MKRTGQGKLRIIQTKRKQQPELGYWLGLYSINKKPIPSPSSSIDIWKSWNICPSLKTQPSLTLILPHTTFSSRTSVLPWLLSSVSKSYCHFFKTLLMQHPPLGMQRYSSFLFISKASPHPHSPIPSNRSATWLLHDPSTAPAKFNKLNTRPSVTHDTPTSLTC